MRQNYPLNPVVWIGTAKNGFVKILDQTKLPHKEVYKNCRNVEDLIESIRNLRIRGAPLLGIAAAYGLVLAGQNSRGNINAVIQAGKLLSKARPTAINLSGIVKRIEKTLLNRTTNGNLCEFLLKEAKRIHQEEELMCQKISRYGVKLIKTCSRIMTICNTGNLATGGIGTALGVISALAKRNRSLVVYACETRPLLQGARLTMLELGKLGIKSHLICDSASGMVMKRFDIDCVITGADRIARNGDTANKVGTYTLAILAKEHNIPFYIAAPSSTFDLSIESGALIPIELRNSKEITNPFGIGIAPLNSIAYNPAFDVTPAKYITAFITDKGVIKPPYKKNIKCIQKFSICT